MKEKPEWYIIPALMNFDRNGIIDEGPSDLPSEVDCSKTAMINIDEYSY